MITLIKQTQQEEINLQKRLDDLDWMRHLEETSGGEMTLMWQGNMRVERMRLNITGLVYNKRILQKNKEGIG